MLLNSKDVAESRPDVGAEEAHLAFELTRTVLEQTPAIVRDAFINGCQSLAGRALQVFFACFGYRQLPGQHVISARNWSHVSWSRHWWQGVTLDILERMWINGGQVALNSATNFQGQLTIGRKCLWL